MGAKDLCPNQISIKPRDPSQNKLTEQARLAASLRGRPSALRSHSAKQKTRDRQLSFNRAARG
jgi:hypothetical protein